MLFPVEVVHIVAPRLNWHAFKPGIGVLNEDVHLSVDVARLRHEISSNFS